MKNNTRSTHAEINLSAIQSNLKRIQKKIGKAVKILAVVKANAYGHGGVEVAQSLSREHADYFGVAFPEEGVALRKAGIRLPIQVLVNLLTREQAQACIEYKLEPTVSSADEAIMIDRIGKSAKRTVPLHLKIDTGMNRVGVKVDSVEGFLGQIKKLQRIEIKSVFTHFATSDSDDKTFANEQLALFRKALEMLKVHGVEPELIHAANSAAILDIPDSYFSMVRPGLALYGYYPSETMAKTIPLQPALSLKTKVSLVKKIQTGESVSYGRKYFASKPTTIATLPLGYGDGVSRLLTGKAQVLIHGERFPVVGTICMDQLMVDAGNADVAVGDDVVLIGTQGSQTISAWDIANAIGTIPYEVCTAIASRVPRIYTNR